LKLPLLIIYISFWLYVYSQQKRKAALAARSLARSLLLLKAEAMSGSVGQMVHSKTTIVISSTAAVEEEEEEEEEFAASKNSNQHVKFHLKIQAEEEEEQQQE
jgi:hypothetical protein